MKFSYNWLKEYLSRMPPAKQLAEDLAKRAFEVESAEPLGRDWVLDIKILSNRAADCFSHLGVAREIAAITRAKFKPPLVRLKEDKSLKIKDFLSVEVKEKKLCPRYSARVLIDIKVGDSPPWLQEKLKACGLRPINNIVDITNFVMLEYGQPLHAFGLDRIESENPKSEIRNPKQIPDSKFQIPKIIVRRAQKDEKIITLDEGRAERILSENILVIADPKRAIGIAGIKGGKGTEIDSSTRRVAIEAANFDSVNIRRSSNWLNLRTDASVRFENGLDNNLTLGALERAAALMQELAGGKVVEGAVDLAAVKSEPGLVGLAHSYLENLLGLEIKRSEVLDVLRRLGLPIKVVKKAQDVFYEVFVPTRRRDLQTAEDLIEEIGRLYGYENIPTEMPRGVLLPAVKENELSYTDQIKDILASLGYTEVYNYSFVSEREKDIYHLSHLAQVLNPLSQEQKHLRPNLAAGLLKNLQENLKYFHSGNDKTETLRLFEVGRIFYQAEKKLKERTALAGIIYLENGQSSEIFYELKGITGSLFNKLGLSDIWQDDHLQEGLPPNWHHILHPPKTAQIKVGQELVGWLGIISPRLLTELAMTGNTAIFEIDLEKLTRLITEEREYQPPSRFPAIGRDLAILVPAEERVQGTLNVIENAGGELLRDVDLFDIYEEDLAEGCKSLAFHLVFQSSERNLSDAEVNQLMQKIIEAVEEKGWEVRK